MQLYSLLFHVSSRIVLRAREFFGLCKGNSDMSSKVFRLITSQTYKACAESKDKHFYNGFQKERNWEGRCLRGRPPLFLSLSPPTFRCGWQRTNLPLSVTLRHTKRCSPPRSYLSAIRACPQTFFPNLRSIFVPPPLVQRSSTANLRTVVIKQHHCWLNSVSD